MFNQSTLTLLILALGVVSTLGAYHSINEYTKNGHQEDTGLTVQYILFVVSIVQVLYTIYLVFTQQSVCSGEVKSALVRNIKARLAEART